MRMPCEYGPRALGCQLFVHLGAKAVHQHDLHAHALDHGQVLRQVVQLAGGNGLARNADHKGLVAELVDVGRHRPEPGHEGEIEDGGHAAREYGGGVRDNGQKSARGAGYIHPMSHTRYLASCPQRA
jgi:hypothetical protein